MDDKDNVWFAEFAVGKVGKYDPVAKSFQEWQLPGSAATPYAFEVDAKGFVWYSSEHQDVIGRLEPISGKIIEYPLPFPRTRCASSSRIIRAACVRHARQQSRRVFYPRRVRRCMSGGLD